MPNCGTIEGRDAPAWRAPSGQQPVTYATFLQKNGDLSHILADHTAADTEAAKFDWTIPAEQWAQTPRRQGRPKASKTAVVTDSDGSDAEPQVNATDLIAKLVADAQQMPTLQLPVVEFAGPVATSNAQEPTESPPAYDIDGPVATSNAQEPVDDNLTPDAFEDDTPLKVTPFTFEDAEYLIDKSSNDLYCTHTHERVGVFHEKSASAAEYVEFIDTHTDSEDNDDE